MVETQATREFKHELPFHIDIISPSFPYVAHGGFSKLIFALIAGLSLAGLLVVAYYLLV